MDVDDEIIDLTPKFVDKKVREKSGNVVIYRIYQCSEAVSMNYRAAMQKGVVFNDKGQPQSMPDGMAESESEFVAGCIRRLDDKGVEHKILLQEVRAMPRPAVAKFFDIASQLSRLDKKQKEEEEDAKKPPSAGADTSD